MSLEAYTKKRFLIVDELDSFRFSTKQGLMAMGIKLIDAVASAREALSAFQNLDYDVILCNYDLGKGRNGQELLEELRVRGQLKYTSLFFIISAEVAKDKVFGTIENEPDGYLVKPIPPAELGKRLAKSLEQKEALHSIDVAIDAGDLDTAIALCEARVAQKARYLLRVQKTLAWLYEKHGQPEAAAAIYKEIMLGYNYDWARFELARLTHARGDLDEAKILLEPLLVVESHHFQAYDLMARIHDMEGDTAKALQVLETAVSLSPNSVKRQKSLAEVASKLSENGRALEAFRKMIKLGEQSVHDQPDNYLGYARFLAGLSFDDLSAEGKQFAREAIGVLDKAHRKYGDDNNVEAKSKVLEARVYIGQHNEEAANRALASAIRHCDEGHVAEQTTLFVAENLYAMNKGDDADRLLTQMADLSGNDDDASEQAITSMLSAKAQQERKEAALLNRQGITLYGKGELNAAIELFEKALELTPRHISLNLNLAQVLIKRLQKQGKTAYDIKNCESCLQRARHIRAHHKEQRRYQYLQDRLLDFKRPTPATR
ncbi:MAG: tetratricopeptide repeat protein [Hahellaceae bacterium]|nr:tetratricopeptide repeat protein [Hahellaceae bacterium]MCP5169366.1 tetratricopeptide repeat protein [Hahellaceae bacterium]